MTKIEFETRTKVNVTADEFETIHNFYMTVDADKDTFCKMWVKMNPRRVAAALEAAKEAARKEQEFAFAVFIYYNVLSQKPLFDEAADYLTEAQFDRLEAMGINPGLRENEYGAQWFASVLDVRADLQRKFNV